MRRVSSIEQPALQQVLAKASAMMRAEPVELDRSHVLLSAVTLVLREAIAVIFYRQ